MQPSEMPEAEFHDFSYVGKFFPNFRRQILEKDDERKLNNMKTKIISRILLSLGLVFVLGSAITQVRGGSSECSAYSTSPMDGQLPVITIHSTGDVTRGKTGSFVLNMTPPMIPGGGYVNFSVSGTAIPGVDYVPPVSPVYVGPSGYGVILVQTLPDPRGSYIRQAYSVVVTLEPGAGYAVGAPNSAQMMIKP
jgi:hypothetical protein